MNIRSAAVNSGMSGRGVSAGGASVSYTHLDVYKRQEKREHHSTLSFEPDIRFDLSAKVLYVSEQPVPLTKSEYSICEYLAKNRGQVFTKEQIYEAVFGFDGIGDNSTISTHIKNIRAKLEHFKISPISTVWGIGYKWE